LYVESYYKGCLSMRLTQITFFLSLLASSDSAFAERPRQALDAQPTFVEALGLEVSPGATIGAEITRIVPGGPAAAIGLEPGDVINSVNGKHVAGPDELVSQLSTLERGTPVRLAYMHQFWEVDKEVMLAVSRKPVTEPAKVAAPTPAPGATALVKVDKRKPLAGYTAIVVEPFTVTNNHHTKNLPPGVEAEIQSRTLAALKESGFFQRVGDASHDGTELLSSTGAQPALVLSGTITGFKPGDSGMRFFVWPLPIGLSETKARFSLRDAASNRELLNFEAVGDFQAASSFGIATKESQLSNVEHDLIHQVLKEIKHHR
jgi:membrane-associated protease RseP (regulator of RpoE activity)